MYVCFSPSPSLSFFILSFYLFIFFFNLQLQFCEGLDVAALEFLEGTFAGTLKTSIDEKACSQRPRLCLNPRTLEGGERGSTWL